MTTQKTLRKAVECMVLNRTLNVNECDTNELITVFAKYFYPLKYKRNKSQACIKTAADLEICTQLGYLTFNHTATNLEDFIELTKEGATRMESKSDNLRNLFVRVLCALGGAIGTVGCSFLIQLIQSHI